MADTNAIKGDNNSSLFSFHSFASLRIPKDIQHGGSLLLSTSFVNIFGKQFFCCKSKELDSLLLETLGHERSVSPDRAAVRTLLKPNVAIFDNATSDFSTPLQSVRSTFTLVRSWPTLGLL